MSSAAAVRKNREFDPNTFLAMIGDARQMLAVPKKQTIFTQGDEADAVFYIQKGKVRLTGVSKTGKEATIGILSEGNFFGEGSLAGQALRMGSAAAMTDCQLLRIEKKAITTRARVSFFMSRVRKLGFIHYNGSLQVHSSLLNVVLHD